MPKYTKQSLEELKSRIDLVDIIGSHIDLKRMGTSYKALCPFHDEKSPSFVVQKGGAHYHCFGCNAHGDAIAFLMEHLGYSFTDAIESLAERYQVTLEKESGAAASNSGPSFTVMKEALANVAQFYHFILLRTEAGKKALSYLNSRGLNQEFIKTFQIGFSPDHPSLFQEAMEKLKISKDILKSIGVVSSSGGGRDLFSGRLVFPVCDAMGRVIGFSARKINEDQPGGKYINTPKTPLFIKSKILFGLNYSRKRMIKEKRAVIVEGQIDALSLIHRGFDFTIATLGTAFGEAHVEELKKLGIKEAILAMDGDAAGKTAAYKAGHLLQAGSIAAKVCQLKEGEDPDTLLRLEGTQAFEHLIDEASDFITFAMQLKGAFEKGPTEKVQAVLELAEEVRAWSDPVLTYETLKALAEKAQLPHHLLEKKASPRKVALKSMLVEPKEQINGADEDVIYWLIHSNANPKEFFELAKCNLSEKDFESLNSRFLYKKCLSLYERAGGLDLIDLCSELSDELSSVIDRLSQKRVNRGKAKELFRKATLKLKERTWLKEREEIKRRIQSGTCEESELLELLKSFDRIKNSPPRLVEPELSINEAAL
jgi:DNA primase